MRSIYSSLAAGAVWMLAVAAMTTDPSRRYVYLTFSDLSGISKVNYTLTYTTRTGLKGFEGGFKNSPRARRTVRRQILGTCSSGKCVFHQQVKNMHLDATFFKRSGGSFSVSKDLL